MPGHIIFHVGAPKTGSTSFQLALEAKQPLLNQVGARYLPRRIVRRHVHPVHDVIRTMKHPGRAAQEIARGRRLLAREFDSCKLLIVSNEHTLIDGPPARLFAGAARQTERLQDLFDGYQVDILLSVRDWQTWLPSFYFYLVQQGETRSFRQFVDGFDAAALDWRVPAQSLLAAFGSAHFNLFTHETLRNQPDFLLRHTLKLAGLGDTGPLSLPIINKSYGIGTIAYMRWWNRVLRPQQRRPKTRRFIRHSLYPVLTHWLRYTPSLRLSGERGAFYHRHYLAQLGELDQFIYSPDAVQPETRAGCAPYSCCNHARAIKKPLFPDD